MKIFSFILFMFISSCLFCQGYFNSLTFAPTALINRTISFTYYKKFINNNEFSINPIVRIAKSSVLYNGSGPLGIIIFNDPFWFYNKYAIRFGYMVPFHKFYIEPMINLEYGYFKKDSLMTEDNSGEAGDKTEVLSREYKSVGLGIIVGHIYDINRIRIKPYYGLGIHFRTYNENIYAKYVWRHIEFLNYPLNSKYNKLVLTIHIGLEIGVNY
jgi:hypothetical protein